MAEQYQGLIKDQKMFGSAEGPWGPQLLAMASQIRISADQYDIKKGQAELAELNVAHLREQLRLARQRQSALEAELERLRTPAPSQN